jgi:hypothetical protein
MVRQWLQPAFAAVCLSTMTTASFAADSSPFPAPPPVVYVADFDLDAASVKPDSGPAAFGRRTAERTLAIFEGPADTCQGDRQRNGG